MKFLFYVLIYFVFVDFLVRSSFSHFNSTEYGFFRKYHSFELDNKLQVLIVSDQTQKNGLILSIDVGSSYEPRKVSGLAHLLEHMLFYSSKKYPNEYHFKHFLATVQGSMNAHTWDCETTYYFEIGDQKLENFDKAMDIFSHFFIDPIFTEDGIKREINAVHNEYEGFLSNEQWRMQELIRNLAVESSVFNHFQIGDNQHLANKNVSILKEIRNFFDNYYSAHKMQVVVYSSFPIEIIKPLIVEKFELIKNNPNWKYPKHFGNLIHSKYEKTTAFTKKNLGLYVWYKGTESKKMVTMMFPLQGELLKINKQVKPLEFIRRLLKKKGRNSFFSIMKKKGLIHDLSMSFLEQYVDFKMIIIKFVLADLNEEKTTLLLKNFFDYIKAILKYGVKENLYKRISFENYIECLYEEKKPIVEEFKQLMAIFKEKKKVDKQIVEEFRNLVKFDKKHIQKYLNYMSDPENALIIFSSSMLEINPEYQQIFRFKNDWSKKSRSKFFSDNKKSFFEAINKKSKNNLRSKNLEKSKTDQKNLNLFFTKKLDHYDNTMNFFFAFEKITPSNIKQLKSGRFPLKSTKFFQLNSYSPQKLDMDTECPYQIQKMPLIQSRDSVKIEYNPTFLFNVLYETFNEPGSTNKMIDLVCLQKEKYKEIHQDYPVMVLKKQRTEVWLKTFQVFEVPKISSLFKLKWASLENSFINDHIFLQIFCKLFQATFWETLNHIKDANYDIELEAREDWMQMSVYGYSDKIERVIKSLFDLLKKAQFSQDSFQNIKKNLLLEMVWKAKEHSFDNLFHYMDIFLNPKFFLEKDLLIHMKSFTYETFLAYLQSFQNSLNIKVLFLGNILKKRAKQLGESLNSYVGNVKTKVESLKKKAQFCVLKKGITTLTLKEISTNHGDNNDATILAYYKENYLEKDVAILDLIIRQFESEAFKFLRTKNQLGYNVGIRYMKNKGIIGVYLYMKGSRFDAEEMGKFGEKFIVNFRAYIEKNRELFEKTSEKQVAKKSNSNGVVFLVPNLKVNAAKYFEGINSGKFLKFRQKNHFKDIGLKEILQFYDQMFFLNKRKLCFQLFSKKNTAKIENEKKLYKDNHSLVKTIYSFDEFHYFITQHH